jgi:hypothetical protein
MLSASSAQVSAQLTARLCELQKAESNHVFGYLRGTGMAEPINLRSVRKRARRRADETRADANRRLHGRPKHVRQLADAQRAKADRDLDGHRIEPGDDR